jgi:hypothetical protein
MAGLFQRLHGGRHHGVLRVAGVRCAEEDAGVEQEPHAEHEFAGSIVIEVDVFAGEVVRNECVSRKGRGELIEEPLELGVRNLGGDACGGHLM